MLRELRQKNFPRSFRIAYLQSVPYKAEEAALKSINAPPPAPPPPAPVVSERDRKALASVCLGLWRMERHLLALLSESDSEPANRTKRSFQRLKEDIEGANIEVEDHTGAKYEAGMSVEAIAFEPTPGLNCDTIKQTVKPTIHLDGKIILQGVVVVGIPGAQTEE